MIVVNFKTYPEVTGEKALKKAKICEQVSQQSGVKIIIGLQATDIYRVTSQVKIPVFAQHLDPLIPGRNTGWTTALSLKKAGVQGVFLNHSEHPFKSFADLQEALKLAKIEGLETLIFSPNLEISKKIDKLKPDYLALEEPSLVSKTAMINFPQFIQIIKLFVKQVKTFPILGAGIRSKKDVEESLKLGVKGIAFASEFVKASDPKQLLLDFASCFL